eukprot:TRINITY_DN4417_c0_g2_i1.p1 TRINITY_DN4417_c0_g2~~TRINITY_DN4417_c0_g2_i1.p1  ORF type:complete len:420 (-),score=21.87 TRINITY_DN4417_c0_g2_i1:805-2064(-)
MPPLQVAAGPGDRKTPTEFRHSRKRSATMAITSERTKWLLCYLCTFSTIVTGAALCSVPTEPHLDCDFYIRSSLKWADFSRGNLTASLTAAWKDVVARIGEYPTKRFQGRGLVITATKFDLVNVRVLLDILRTHGANVSVEVWYTGQIDSGVLATLFSTYTKMAVKTLANYAGPHDLRSTYTGPGDQIFQAKPIAVLKSAFEDVLFLAADSIPLSNPCNLFSTPEYLSTGALVWPDFWQTATANPIWSILGLSPGGWEQESGQMVLNKRLSWAALNLAVFLAKEPAFQRILNGDKEAFRLAFLATGSPFHMVKTPVATAGVNLEGGEFCGHTRVQHDTRGQPLFLQHNSIRHGASTVWDVMKAVPAGKSFSVVPLPPITINNEPVSCLDITGDDVVAAPAPFVSFKNMFARWSQASTVS